jgi:hypothetical protein
LQGELKGEQEAIEVSKEFEEIIAERRGMEKKGGKGVYVQYGTSH